MSNIHRAALAIIVAAPFIAPRAEACSFYEPTIEELRFALVDDATLPTNGILFAGFLRPEDDDGSTWWLVNDTETVALTMTILAERRTRFIPERTLSPSTTYTLRWSSTDAPPSPPAPVNDGADDEPIRQTITTGAGPDDEAPRAPIVASETKAIFSNPFGDSCGPVEGSTWARFFITPDPDGDVAAYHLFNDDELVDVELTSVGSLTDDGDFFVSEIATEGGTHTYRIVAVDHAGNESEPTLVDMNLGCEGSCSSADLTGVSSLGALLLLARRRRSRR